MKMPFEIDYSQHEHLVEVTQAGGKYGTFTCPLCGGRGDYKFMSSCGGCRECGAFCFDFGGIYVELDGREHADALIELKVQA
jgi:hypothetical protein